MNVPIKRGTWRRLGIVRPLPPGVYWAPLPGQRGIAAVTALVARGTARRPGLRLPRRHAVWIDGDAFLAPAGHLTPEMAKVLFGGFTMAEAEEGAARLIEAVRAAAGMDAAEQAILVRFHDKAGKPVFQTYDGGKT